MALQSWRATEFRQHPSQALFIIGYIAKIGISSKGQREVYTDFNRLVLCVSVLRMPYSFGAWFKTAAERLHRNNLTFALANKLARIAWSVLRLDRA